MKITERTIIERTGTCPARSCGAQLPLSEDPDQDRTALIAHLSVTHSDRTPTVAADLDEDLTALRADLDALVARNAELEQGLTAALADLDATCTTSTCASLSPAGGHLCVRATGHTRDHIGPLPHRATWPNDDTSPSTPSSFPHDPSRGLTAERTPDPLASDPEDTGSAPHQPRWAWPLTQTCTTCTHPFSVHASGEPHRCVTGRTVATGDPDTHCTCLAFTTEVNPGDPEHPLGLAR